MLRTRLAPSPTGALHLGNARSFLLTWLFARTHEHDVVIRMEDLDGPRTKAGAAEQALDDLRWLGLDWDGEVLEQSTRSAAYAAALAKLHAEGLVYACVCTRKEIEAAASAPNEGEVSRAYPGTCRERFKNAEDALAATGRQPAWRFRVESGESAYTDLFRGDEHARPANVEGDFVVAKKTGEAAYQLAVVVDDAHQHVEHVIRGDDLVPSTHLQILLYKSLGLSVPAFSHLPLVRGEDGRRLAKRHGDTRLAHYRERGVSPERVLGLLADWSGLAPRAPISAQDLLARGCEWSQIPVDDVVFTATDDGWLLQKN